MSSRTILPPRRSAGFTLVEVLVVMGILALLLAILFPVFNAIRRNQKIRRTGATVEAIASGIQAYQNDWGIYPPSEFAGSANSGNPLVQAYAARWGIGGSALDVNRGNRSLIVLLNIKGGRSAPYLPSAFYEDGEIDRPLLLDEWERPLIYFDTSVMRSGLSHVYDILGTNSVRPAETSPGNYSNFGRFQLWSCGPNERNDHARGEAEGADDIAAK